MLSTLLSPCLLLLRVPPIAAADASSSLAPLLNDVNILIVTDTHSWIGGHGQHESHHDADYGDVLSFHSHLTTLADESQDVWFVMNGDFMHGTGLSTDPPEFIIPLLEQMPWDVLNIGNHELYDDSTINYITQKDGFVDYWDGRYLTSNTVHVNTTSSIGERYRFLQGSTYTLLSFGFLYNMEDPCPTAHVETVEEVVNSTWFEHVLLGNEGSFDAILMLAHMDAESPLLTVLLDKIRSICGDSMTVQFVTGHSHERKYIELDDYSTSFEAGRYLDTLGFVSFSLSSNDEPNFSHKFIETSVKTMAETLDLDSLETSEGRSLSSSIQNQRQALGLFDVLGCATQTYNLTLGMNETNSLWGLFANKVVHSELLDKNRNVNRLYIQDPGAFRYDLYEGVVFLDDIVGVNPFNDSIILVTEDITGSEFLEAFEHHIDNSSHKIFDLTEYVISAKKPIQDDMVYQVYTTEFDLSYVQEQLEAVTGRSLSPVELKEETTGIYWTNYIENNWPCTLLPEDINLFGGGGDGGKSYDFEWMKFVTMILVVSIISFTMWFVVYRSEYGYSLRSGYPEEDATMGFGKSQAQRTQKQSTESSSLENQDSDHAAKSWDMVVSPVHDFGSVDGEEATLPANNIASNKEVNQAPSSSLSPSELI